MASSGTLKGSEAQPLWQKIGVVLPGLAVFGSFAASALAMKIAPFFGLLPGDTNKEILKAWAKWSALPQLQMVLKPLGFDSKKFMLAVATTHLVIALMLVLPTGKWGTRLAGLWAMVAMAGAEFCTRTTSHVPPGFPKEFQWVGVLITSATHVGLFICGAFLVFSKYRGGLVPMLNDLLASAKKASSAGSSPSKTSSEELRGRSGSKSPDKKTRDSTPKPTTKKAGETSPVSPSARSSSRGRGRGKK